jgi:hypothetical protein
LRSILILMSFFDSLSAFLRPMAYPVVAAAAGAATASPALATENTGFFESLGNWYSPPALSAASAGGTVITAAASNSTSVRACCLAMMAAH